MHMKPKPFIGLGLQRLFIVVTVLWSVSAFGWGTLIFQEQEASFRAFATASAENLCKARSTPTFDCERAEYIAIMAKHTPNNWANWYEDAARQVSWPALIALTLLMLIGPPMALFLFGAMIWRTVEWVVHGFKSDQHTS